MCILSILSLISFVYAGELDYQYRPVEHSSSVLSFTPDSVGKRFSVTSAESSKHPISYNGAAGFGGYETEFYTFTAPEDVFDEDAAVQKLSDSLKKKVRVIFIKNPENTAYENAALALIKQAAEQRTVIYVLNKQHGIAELADKFNTIQVNLNHKPEVHFVKYRTPEDAYNAQRAIQSQYGPLGGSAQNYNAPAVNLVAPASNAFHGSFQTPNSEYYPPIYPRFKF